jgi:hypothetical protein
MVTKLAVWRGSDKERRLTIVISVPSDNDPAKPREELYHASCSTRALGLCSLVMVCRSKDRRRRGSRDRCRQEVPPRPKRWTRYLIYRDVKIDCVV